MGVLGDSLWSARNGTVPLPRGACSLRTTTGARARTSTLQHGWLLGTGSDPLFIPTALQGGPSSVLKQHEWWGFKCTKNGQGPGWTALRKLTRRAERSEGHSASHPSPSISQSHLTTWEHVQPELGGDVFTLRSCWALDSSSATKGLWIPSVSPSITQYSTFHGTPSL